MLIFHSKINMQLNLNGFVTTVKFTAWLTFGVICVLWLNEGGRDSPVIIL